MTKRNLLSLPIILVLPHNFLIQILIFRAHIFLPKVYLEDMHIAQATQKSSETGYIRFPSLFSGKQVPLFFPAIHSETDRIFRWCKFPHFPPKFFCRHLQVPNFFPPLKVKQVISRQDFLADTYKFPLFPAT